MRKAFVLLLLLATVAGAGTLYLHWSARPEISFRSSPVKRGDLVVSISATGTVEPVEVIDVGAQVAGKIKEFGKDAGGKPVDYGTHVEQGMVLAVIDDALFAADAQQAVAQVEQAKATVDREKADLEQMRVKLNEAERNWKRAKELGPSRALSATEFDAYQAAYETARATVAVGEATVAQAMKGVASAEAVLNRSRTYLGYCTIRSPVDGVIIDRRVNIGQTVVASLNAPSLFLIAKDLKKMQVWVAVNEADIGQIYPKQRVNFTVDAYPHEQFVGEVGKIRLNASMVQNVVNFTVEVNTDNSDGKLLPYLTANVNFEVAKHENVLTVPNAALRYKPSAKELIVPEARAEFAGAVSARTAKRAGSRAKTEDNTGVLWAREGDFVRPARVKVGLNDDSVSEIESDAVQEGAEVVISEIAMSNGDGTRNPFAPQFFGGPKRGP